MKTSILPTDYLSILNDLKPILMKIDNKVPVFFNVSLFENKLKIVYSRKKWGKNASGNIVWIGTDWFLTEKGKQILNFQP